MFDGIGGSPPMEDTVEGAGSRLNGLVEGGRGGSVGLVEGGRLLGGADGGSRDGTFGLPDGGGAKSISGFAEAATVIVVSVDASLSSRFSPNGNASPLFADMEVLVGV